MLNGSKMRLMAANKFSSNCYEKTNMCNVILFFHRLVMSFFLAIRRSSFAGDIVFSSVLPIITIITSTASNKFRVPKEPNNDIRFIESRELGDIVSSQEAFRLPRKQVVRFGNSRETPNKHFSIQLYPPKYIA